MKTFARWAAALLGTAAALFCLGAYLIDRPGPERVPRVVTERMMIDCDNTDFFTFAILSDIQGGFHYLPKLSQRIRDLCKFGPTVVILLGDVSADHDEAHMQLPVRELQHDPPAGFILAIPGNHDIRGERGAVEWARWFGPRTFDFQLFHTHFLGLDNSQGPLDAAALARLKDRLEQIKRHKKRHPTVLCLHRDVVDWEGKAKKGAEEANRALLDLIKDYDVPLVLMGHWHQAIEVARGKTKFVVVPPSGDASRDTGSLPVTLTLVDWNQGEFTLRYDRIERDFWTDLEGFYIHMALAHVRMQPLWTICALLACAAGWWLFVRWKRAPAAGRIAPEVKT